MHLNVALSRKTLFQYKRANYLSEYKGQVTFGEVTEVTEVLIDDVATEEYSFEPITQKITINVSFSKVKITFKAGYNIPPKVVLQAVLMAISTTFNNRDDVVIGESVAKLPMTSLKLLDRVKFHGS
ncbi:unnamed protein product [marine sediment metagenome]|uniref:Phage gp6-like head-tail connector protein n=1 Tax=marine sediment metagenome TaxID=412755 RepID=X1SBI2_9ZZZZ